MDILLRNGYVVDSANSFEGIRDILIRDGVLRKIHALELICLFTKVVYSAFLTISSKMNASVNKLSAVSRARRISAKSVLTSPENVWL